MSSLALTSGWYYICTSYCTPDIEFQVQSIYLIYTRLIVHTTLNLAYSKKHMIFIRLTYGKYAV